MDERFEMLLKVCVFVVQVCVFVVQLCATKWICKRVKWRVNCGAKDVVQSELRSEAHRVVGLV